MKKQSLMRMTGLAGAVLLSAATLLTTAGASTAVVAYPRPPHTPIIKG